MTRGMPIPDDWDEQQDGYALAWFCVPDSVKWRAFARGMLYELTRGRNWDETTGNIKDTQAIAWEMYGSLCMANCDDIYTQLNRIADSLESIDTKTSQLITWDDFINDLENAFGVSSVLVSIVNGIFSLMPTIRAKMDFTPIVLGIWNYLTWRAPVKTMLATISASQVTMAASAATARVIGIINTVLSGLGLLTSISSGWKDIIFGDKNLLDDLVNPIWKWFIADTDGGAGGDDPDTDPSLRAITNVFVAQQAASVNVSCCSNCGGAVCQCWQTDEQIGDASEFGPEPEPFVEPTVGYGTSGYYDRKCKMSNAVYENLAAFFGALEDNNIGSFSGNDAARVSLLTLLGVIIGELSTPVPLLDGLAGGVIGFLAGVANGVVFGSYVLADINAYLASERDNVICALYNADSVAEAQNELGNTLSAAGLDAGSVTFLKTVATLDMLAYLFFSNNQSIEAAWDDQPVLTDCSATCESAQYVWEFVADSENWIFTDNSIAPATGVGTHITENLRVQMTNGGGEQAKCVWTYNILSEAIVAASGMKFSALVRRLSFCSTGITMRIRYDDDSVDSHPYNLLYWTTYKLATVTVTQANAGKTIKELEIFYTNGTDCGSGSSEVQTDRAEFEL